MPHVGDSKRRLPEMLTTVVGVLEQVYVCRREYLKGINDEISIRSFTELFDEALCMLHGL
jgi:hypothetical protein